MPKPYSGLLSVLDSVKELIEPISQYKNENNKDIECKRKVQTYKDGSKICIYTDKKGNLLHKIILEFLQQDGIMHQIKTYEYYSGRTQVKNVREEFYPGTFVPRQKSIVEIDLENKTIRGRVTALDRNGNITKDVSEEFNNKNQLIKTVECQYYDNGKRSKSYCLIYVPETTTRKEEQIIEYERDGETKTKEVITKYHPKNNEIVEKEIKEYETGILRKKTSERYDLETGDIIGGTFEEYNDVGEFLKNGQLPVMIENVVDDEINMPQGNLYNLGQNPILNPIANQVLSQNNIGSGNQFKK